MDGIPSFLHPLARPLVFFPAFRIKQRMRAILGPIVRRDMEYLDHKSAHPKPGDESRLPLTHWLTARYNHGEATQSQLTEDYINLCTFSAVKCASLMSSIVLELAARPELQDELNREVKSVLVNGQLPATQLKELRKMDSVMREISRVHPFSSCKRPLSF